MLSDWIGCFRIGSFNLNFVWDEFNLDLDLDSIELDWIGVFWTGLFNLNLY